jgi:hypothetical protein
LETSDTQILKIKRCILQSKRRLRFGSSILQAIMSINSMHYLKKVFLNNAVYNVINQSSLSKVILSIGRRINGTFSTFTLDVSRPNHLSSELVKPFMKK